MSMNRYL